MRIKIDGPITASRIAEAFELAKSKAEGVLPNSLFINANLYLTWVDVSGRRTEMVDDAGNEIVLSLDHCSDAEQILGNFTASAEIPVDEVDLDWEKEREERDAVARAYWTQLEAEQENYELLVDQTQLLVQEFPQRFVDELNETVRLVWDELQPSVPLSRQQRGISQIKPRPYYSIERNELIMTVATWKRPRHVKTPIGTRPLSVCGQPVNPFWDHAGWKEAINRIVGVMTRLSQDLDPSLLK